MRNEQFDVLKGHLQDVLKTVEKLESGKVENDYMSVLELVEFEVGCALIDVFNLTKREPKATLDWISDMCKEE